LTVFFTPAFDRLYAMATILIALRQEDHPMSESEKNGTPRSPRETDTAADHVEKKPREKESPQQKHDNEDHG
jgi:hypothetical protein